MNYAGVLLSVEGMDGSGKDTAVETMRGHLLSKGFQVEVIHPLKDSYLKDFWYTGFMSNKQDVNPFARTLLALSAMSDILEEKIIPALSAGKVVILNRWLDSTIVYQGGAEEVGVDAVSAVAALMLSKLTPDYTLLLDVKPDVARERLLASGRPLDKHESYGQDFHEQIRNGYLRLVFENRTRFLVIDANKEQVDVQNVVAETTDKIMGILGGHCANNYGSTDDIVGQANN